MAGRASQIGSILSSLGGLIILLASLMSAPLLIDIGSRIAHFIPDDELRAELSGMALLAFTILAGVGIASGILVLVMSYLAYTKSPRLGGLLVVLFSLLSSVVGGGFLIGLVLGVIGGVILALKGAKPS